MEVTLSKEDIKNLICALSLYMKGSHITIQVKLEDFVFVPNYMFDRHIDLLNKLHDLQNRLLEHLDLE